MFDLGINKKGRIRCKKTLLKVARDYYEMDSNVWFSNLPQKLMNQDYINQMEKWKLEDILNEKPLNAGSSRKDNLLWLYQKIKNTVWLIE